MTRSLRARFGAACLVLMTAYASPSFAADLPVVSRAQPVLATTLPAAAVAPLAAPAITATAATPVTVAPAAAAPLAINPAPAKPAVPLRDLVIAFVNRGDQDAEQTCLAKAVYFEARSEPLEGQLAVAQVILNRAASGRFGGSLCEVVTQPAQFSFVRAGRLPSPDTGSDCWHKALAIADIARKRTLTGEIGPDVLWYHATYVSPSWDRQRTRFAQIGKHIFFS